MKRSPRRGGFLSDVGCHGYHWVMVDNALAKLVRQLSAEDKAELRAIIDADLAEYVSPELAVRLDARWAEVMAGPDDYVSIDEDERELRARRRVA